MEAAKENDADKMERVLKELASKVPSDKVPEGDKPKIKKAAEKVKALREQQSKWEFYLFFIFWPISPLIFLEIKKQKLKQTEAQNYVEIKFRIFRQISV